MGGLALPLQTPYEMAVARTTSGVIENVSVSAPEQINNTVPTH